MSSIFWEVQRIPRWAAAVLTALRFSGSSTTALEALDRADWERALRFCDRAQMTLLLLAVPGALPEWVRQRVGRNLADNSERTERIKRAWFEIDDSFRATGVACVVLKGLAQWPHYITDPRLRVQYDFDIYCPPEHLYRARDVLAGLGYEGIQGLEDLPIDHLPTMHRETGRRWGGNYFDPELPLAVDLHFRLWDPETECFDAPGIDRFWERRTARTLDGRALPVFHPADGLAYCALHLLRHWLRGNVRPYHVYELAWLLDTRAGDEAFWTEWRELHGPELRRLQAIGFRLAADWFGCRVAGTVREEFEALPEAVRLWFARYSATPLETQFRPNKDELWLHYCLLASRRDIRRVFRRRLFPARMPEAGNPHVPGERVSWARRLRERAKYTAYVALRVLHHARTLVPTLWHGRFWVWQGRGLGKRFWQFMAAASLFNFGAFVFALLYNLYLLDLGYREGFIGLVTGATAAGSIFATLPAGLLAERWGLRATLSLVFGSGACVFVLRALPIGTGGLLVTAFLGGAVLAVWAVSIAPVIAQLSDEVRRPRAFSAFFGSSIALGILGGLVGGRLPGWLAHAFALGPMAAKRAALIAAAAFAVLALWPAARLALARPGRSQRKSYPGGPFIRRYLLVLAVWSLATGSFNPFYNAFFSRHLHMPVERIGMVFSAGQAAQVGALLLAPLILRRFGLVAGIAGMQLATGATLACLALTPSASAAAAGFAAYMAAQWMSEPGLYSLLMGRVTEETRTGASALNFLVAFLFQAIAAAGAGAAFVRFGYPAVIGAAAGMAVLSSLLFRRLLAPFRKPLPPSGT